MKKSTNMDHFELPGRLRNIRVTRNMTQTELAKSSGVSQSTIAHIESGRKDPSITTLKKICKAMNFEMAYILAPDHVHVFDMNGLRVKYKDARDLDPPVYKALGEVLRWAKDIGYL